MTAANRREIFGAFEIRPGSENLDFDVDCRPWLTGTALMAAFELEPDAGHPITYASPVVLFDGSRSAKLVATCPDGTPPGDYWVRVKLTDNQGRVDRQWFQMAVV